MRKTILLLMLAGMPSCDAFTGPGPLAHLGSYTLAEVDGAPLPAPLLKGESAALVDALSGSLRLEKEMLGTHPKFMMSLVWQFSTARGVEVDSATYSGIYLHDGGPRFTLVFEGNRALCPEFTGCGHASMPNGTYKDQEFRFQGNPAVLTFRKR